MAGFRWRGRRDAFARVVGFTLAVSLGDDKLAAATIDRLVHHGRLVEFNGPSRRMDAALMLGKAGT